MFFGAPIIHEVPRWLSNFAPGIKTKFKELNGAI